jgi:hypothetical protein
MSRHLCVGVVVIALPALAACGRLNRVATLNQSTSGAAVAAALRQQLARQGFPSTRVTCGKTVIVNVGTRTSCQLAGAGPQGTVRFTFSSSDGAIDPASVKAS